MKNKIAVFTLLALFAFSSLNAQITTPTNSAPANNAVDISLTPTFTWDGGTSHTVEVSSDVSFSVILYTSGGDVVSGAYSIPGGTPLTNNTTYYWRAVNNGGSGYNTFSTLLATPVVTAPLASSSCVSLTPTFTWTYTGPTSGVTFDLIYDDGGGPVTVNNVTSGYFGTTFTANTNYTYTITAKKTGFTNQASTSAAFQTTFLTFPANLASGVSIAPTFTWSDPAGASGANYALTVATDDAFSNIVISQAAISNLYYEVPLSSKLDNATIYYWRVVGTGGTVTTATGKFSTIFAAIPSLVSPAHLETIVGNTINFQWTMPTSSLKYIVEVDDDPAFTTQASGFPTAAQTLNYYSCNYTLSTLPADTYYWRVKTYTTTDILVSISSAYQFTISGPPTAVPAYPINLTTVYSNSPTIYWYLNNYFYNQGVYYRVRYGTTSTGPYTTGTSPITTNNWVPLNGLTIGQTYYYVIDASTSSGFGTYTTSQEGSFVVYYSAIASVPIYLSFPLGNTVYSLSPTLYWFLGVHVPGVAFDVQVNDGTDFTSNLPLEVNETGVSSYQFTTPELTAGTSYTWRVRISGSTVWYGPETFTIDASATAAESSLDANIPTPLYPIGGTVVLTQSPVLSWISSSLNSLEYQIVYSSDPSLDVNGVLVNITPPNDAGGGISGWLITNSYALSGLTQGATYYWQVRSRLASPPNTVSNYSSVAQFTIDPGANPVVVLPANPISGSTLNINAANLSWVVPAQSESALTYDLEISNNEDMSSATLINDLEQPSYSVNNLDANTNYYWRVRSKTTNGEISDYSYKGEFSTGAEATDVNSEEALPSSYELYQNYPNPFNPTTRISYTLPKNSFVALKIYDVLGREIKTLVNKELNAGTYNIDWNGVDNSGRKVASGTYIYRISAGSFIMSRKMLLIK
jgi:hypothetical protein